MDPTEWFAWVYGKFFTSHPIRGGIVICSVGAIVAAFLFLVLYVRAIDKWNSEHPKVTAEATSAVQKPVSDNPTYQELAVTPIR